MYNDIFDLYKRLSKCYEGTSQTTTELVLEAKLKCKKVWKIVKNHVQCIGDNERRIVYKDGKKITYELKDDGNYDSIITAKLMCLFEKYIRSVIWAERTSFPADEIMYQAELSLRYALELYQPIREVTRYKVNTYGQKEAYKTKINVKFEEFWRQIFKSKIQGIYQDSNRDCRKLNHEVTSLNALEEDDNIQFVSENDVEKTYMNNNNCSLIDLLDNKYKKENSIMKQLIVNVYSKVPVVSIKNSSKIMYINENEYIPEGYKVKKISDLKKFTLSQYISLKHKIDKLNVSLEEAEHEFDYAKESIGRDLKEDEELYYSI